MVALDEEGGKREAGDRRSEVGSEKREEAEYARRGERVPAEL